MVILILCIHIITIMGLTIIADGVTKPANTFPEGGVYELLGIHEVRTGYVSELSGIPGQWTRLLEGNGDQVRRGHHRKSDQGRKDHALQPLRFLPAACAQILILSL